MSDRSIRKDGFLYQLAYFDTKEDAQPKRVSLCVVVWRAVFTGAIILLLGSAVLTAAIFVIGGALIFLWGITMAMYELFSHLTVQQLAALPQNKNFQFVLVVLAIFGGSATLVGIVFTLPFASRHVYRWLKAHETGRLILAYLKAKKEKVCPIYDVV